MSIFSSAMVTYGDYKAYCLHEQHIHTWAWNRYTPTLDAYLEWCKAGDKPFTWVHCDNLTDCYYVNIKQVRVDIDRAKFDGYTFHQDRWLYVESVIERMSDS